MANEINLNNPRTMKPARSKNMPVTTFIRDTFFGQAHTFLTKTVDVDFRKGGRQIAPFVAKNVGGINMERKGFETKNYEPPKIAPQRPLSPEVLEPRLPGETVHTTQSPEERQDYFLEQDSQEMEDSISRREELMCSELLTDGKVTVKGYIDNDLTNFRTDEVDYQFNNKTILTGTDAWNDPGATKYKDLDKAVENVHKAGYNAEMAIIGQDAWADLSSDSDFKDKLDNRRMEMGMINPEFRTVDGHGVKYLGFISDLGIDFYTYYSWYMDYDGVIKPYFPSDHVAIAPKGIGEMLYAAVTQLEDDKRYHTYEGTRVPKIFADTSNDVMTFRMTSKPLPAPFDIDSWQVLDTRG
jgi:hypothetical protein